MCLLLRRLPRMTAGSLFVLAIAGFAPSPSPAVEFTIQRESDQTALVSVVPGQEGFDMSAYTGGLDGHPFPTGWRTVLVLLVQPFDATTNYSGNDIPSISQAPVGAWGNSSNSLEQNGYALTAGTKGATLVNWGPTGVAPPWIVPPSLDLWFTTPPLPISGDLTGSVDVTLDDGHTLGEYRHDGDGGLRFLHHK